MGAHPYTVMGFYIINHAHIWYLHRCFFSPKNKPCALRVLWCRNGGDDGRGGGFGLG